jgi:predicted nucleic-acid-binding Zn-ribbon protein
MACKKCGSENLMNLKGEITASFPRIEDVKAAPIYFAQEFGICLECGFAELQVPAAQLEALRKKKASGS